MPLHLTAARSSRVTKPRQPQPRSRQTSSSSKPSRGRRRGQDQQDVDSAHDDSLGGSTLEELRPVRSFSGRIKPRGVLQCLHYIAQSMFDDIPEQRSGMDSTRQVELRNFRATLPPLATAAHVYALSQSPTAAEREVAQLTAKGSVRKITVPGRGLGTSAIGELLVLTEQWIAQVEEDDSLSDDTKQKYVAILQANPGSTTTSSAVFTPPQVSALVRSGFLTAGTVFTRELPGSFTSPSGAMRGSLSSLASAGARNATGTMDAVGGHNAILHAGGRMTGQASPREQMLNFTLPSVGVYLRLLASARDHLVGLLGRSKHREAPSGLLGERWDGGVWPVGASAAGPVGRPAVPPGRTRKWKQFYGMRYQWVLEECLGTGAIECFDTRSVGLGVRLPG